ncbi:L,D-transpeptidase family protein [Methylocapsa palsarum]|uniref:Murein L,D-transpeptidase YcbB/YkuD n=1 Tax=Methylocapsa palsarum TaxID=1612308 RepID=A0A1I3VWC6_9HYPH|nr:L,D-transpeptidase family protein [Methylocapsa palsarum]SFJ99449.1 Murein L,D-transpeptidase YcbB/YkuD [Methylocapsa palsarum]
MRRAAVKSTGIGAFPALAILAGLAGSPLHAQEQGHAAPSPEVQDAGARSLAFLPQPAADAGQDLEPRKPDASLETDPSLGLRGEDAGPPATDPAVSAPPSAAAPVEGAAQTAESPPLAPLNAAVKAVLEARAHASPRPGAQAQRREREAVAAFYAARGFAPLWSKAGEPNPEVKSAVARLERAGDDGLNLKNFPLSPIRPGANEDVAAADVALSDAVLAYGRQASGSRIEPRLLSPLIGTRPEVADPSLILATVSSAGDEAGAALLNFNPPQEGYIALRRKLDELRRERGPSVRAPAIPAGPVLRVGMRDPRVPLIRARLSLDGRDDVTTEDLVYDQRVASAVADFQKANGLPPSGMLTPRTISVLSGGEPSRLEAEIIANMERWRWMPRDLGERRIEVNIPDFEVVIIDNGRVVQRNRVVVGKVETPTPIFSNTMQFLIVNPAWNVPQSIIKKEMIGRLGYLSQHGYQVSSNEGRITVRQPPGERNALGKIKFMFPNDYAVYLHDTPSRALFSESKRAFSHGCVRVDEPFSFAQSVLGPKWSESRIKGLIGGKERYVNLPAPLPIHIEYFTAFVDASGRLQLRDDLYGYSRRVKAALGLEG